MYLAKLCHCHKVLMSTNSQWSVSSQMKICLSQAWISAICTNSGDEQSESSEQAVLCVMIDFMCKPILVHRLRDRPSSGFITYTISKELCMYLTTHPKRGGIWERGISRFTGATPMGNEIGLSWDRLTFLFGAWLSLLPSETKWREEEPHFDPAERADVEIPVECWLLKVRRGCCWACGWPKYVIDFICAGWAPISCETKYDLARCFSGEFVRL